MDGIKARRLMEKIEKEFEEEMEVKELANRLKEMRTDLANISVGFSSISEDYKRAVDIFNELLYKCVNYTVVTGNKILDPSEGNYILYPNIEL